MIEKLKVGDSVKIEWYATDHIRIKNIEILGNGAKEEKKKEKSL